MRYTVKFKSETRITVAPRTTKAMPSAPVVQYVDAAPGKEEGGECSSFKKTSKRETTKPKAITVSPVRTQARRVRSDAK